MFLLKQQVIFVDHKCPPVGSFVKISHVYLKHPSKIPFDCINISIRMIIKKNCDAACFLPLS